jgi:hypothetical protein
MSIYDKAGVALIPSGYKAGTTDNLYSVLPANGNGDFNATRGSSATRVNKDGLIESVATNVPRLDYPLIDGVVQDCPALLLEPQRTNYAGKSEEFNDSYWQKVRATITANQIVSPDGSVTADLLTATDTSENYCQQNVSSTVSGSQQTASFFVKKGTSDFCHILLWDVSNDGARQWFDLTNGSVGTSTTFGSGVSVDSAQMINYGNGWYRCVVVFNNSNTTVRIRISVSNSNGSTSSTSGKMIYIWGAQLTVSSYETSYIPNTTTGSVTRSADVCNGSGTSAEFNDSEGVLFAEFSALANDGTTRVITINDTSNQLTERVQLFILGTSMYGRITDGGVTQGEVSSTPTLTDNNKIAFKYKVNDFALWINGVEVDTSSSGSTPNGLDTIRFDAGTGGSPFYGKVKQVIYFNEELSDSELATLTS